MFVFSIIHEAQHNVLWEMFSRTPSCTWGSVTDWMIVCLCCCDSGWPERRGGYCTEEGSSDGKKATEGKRDADQETATGGRDGTKERSSTVRKTPKSHNNRELYDHSKLSHTITDTVAKSKHHAPR